MMEAEIIKIWGPWGLFLVACIIYFRISRKDNKEAAKVLQDAIVKQDLQHMNERKDIRDAFLIQLEKLTSEIKEDRIERNAILRQNNKEVARNSDVLGSLKTLIEGIHK